MQWQVRVWMSSRQRFYTGKMSIQNRGKIWLCLKKIGAKKKPQKNSQEFPKKLLYEPMIRWNIKLNHNPCVLIYVDGLILL